MADGESGRNDQRRDVAAIPRPMPNAARFRSCDGRSYARFDPVSAWLPLSLAAAGGSALSSNWVNSHRKPKRHETVWRAVASRKGSWDNKRRNLATVPEGLPDAARLNDERSSARRVAPAAAAAPATPAPAPALRQRRRNRVHCFHGSGQQLRRLEVWHRAEADRRRPNKLSIVVPDQPSFGSMSTRTSTISQARETTPTRRAELTCAKLTRRPQVIARRRTSIILEVRSACTELPERGRALGYRPC